MSATDRTCAFCGGSPDDWCPGCLSLLCDDCSPKHRGSLDGPCTHNGKPIPSRFVCGPAEPTEPVRG